MPEMANRYMLALVRDARGWSQAKLAERAWALGMRPNPQPAFIQLPGGQVVGVPTEVTGDELTGIVPVATPTPASSPSPSPVPEPSASAAETSAAAQPAAESAAPNGTGETR